MLDRQKWNDLQGETPTLHNGTEETTIRGKSVSECPERRGTSSNTETKDTTEEEHRHYYPNE